VDQQSRSYSRGVKGLESDKELVAGRCEPSAKPGVLPPVSRPVNTLASEQDSEVSETSTSCNSLLTQINIYILTLCFQSRFIDSNLGTPPSILMDSPLIKEAIKNANI